MQVSGVNRMFTEYEDTPPNLLEERVRGNQAQYILDNEAFKEAMTIMKARVLQAWKETSLQNTEERDFYWLQIKAIDALEINLKTMLETGKMASIQMEIEDKKILSQIKDRLFG